MNKNLSPPASVALTLTALSNLSWWGQLNQEDQLLVKTEVTELRRAKFREGASKLDQGKHLLALRDALEPKRCFVRLLDTMRINTRTAYRYMDLYKEARRRFPGEQINWILASGIDIWKYPDSVLKRNPPPQLTSDIREIKQYEKKLVQDVRLLKKGRLEGSKKDGDEYQPPTTDELMGQCFAFWRARFRQLPNNSKSRANWTRDLVGMLLTEMGVSGSQSFSAIAVPEEFRRGPGRPKTLEASA